MRYISIILAIILFSPAYSQEIQIIKLRKISMQERALLKTVSAAPWDGDYLIGKADFNDDRIEDLLIVDISPDMLSARGEAGASLLIMGKNQSFYHLRNGTALPDTMQFTLGPVQANGIRSLIMTRDGFILRGNKPDTPLFSKILEYAFTPTPNVKIKSTAQNNSEASFLSSNDQPDQETDHEDTLKSIEEARRARNREAKIRGSLQRHSEDAKLIGFFSELSDAPTCEQNKLLNHGKCVEEITEQAGYYIGELIKNIPYGRGAYVYKSPGNSFNWTQTFGGIFPEAGTRQRFNKLKYVGEWRNGLETGVGFLSLSSNFDPDLKANILAHWTDGNLNGPIYFDTKNACFNGVMENGAAEGGGISSWSVEEKDTIFFNRYFGNFSHGVRNGHGILLSRKTPRYKSGEYDIFHIGGFQDGKAHGAGTRITVDSTKPGELHQFSIESGLWNNGILTASGEVAFLPNQMANFDRIPTNLKADKIPMFAHLARRILRTKDSQDIIDKNDSYQMNQNRSYLTSNLNLTENRNLPFCSDLSASKNKACYFVGHIDLLKYWPETKGKKYPYENPPSQSVIYVGMALHGKPVGEAIIIQHDNYYRDVSDTVKFINFSEGEIKNPFFTIADCSIIPTSSFVSTDGKEIKETWIDNIGWETFSIMKNRRF